MNYESKGRRVVIHTKKAKEPLSFGYVHGIKNPALKDELN
jgi:hypothetical protein